MDSELIAILALLIALLADFVGRSDGRREEIDLQKLTRKRKDSE